MPARHPARRRGRRSQLAASSGRRGASTGPPGQPACHRRRPRPPGRRRLAVTPAGPGRAVRDRAGIDGGGVGEGEGHWFLRCVCRCLVTRIRGRRRFVGWRRLRPAHQRPPGGGQYRVGVDGGGEPGRVEHEHPRPGIQPDGHAGRRKRARRRGRAPRRTPRRPGWRSTRPVPLDRGRPVEDHEALVARARFSSARRLPAGSTASSPVSSIRPAEPVVGGRPVLPGRRVSCCSCA